MSALAALWLRFQIWMAERRVVFLQQEADMHASLGASLADQALQIQREITVARCELSQ